MKYPQLVSMPSAVSDWLEEQLEARGIDAVVYTRYVLSLLHRDTLDLISIDQDIQSSKEVRQRQSGGGRKRFRRSSEWWSHVRADVEQLRRSAAVECLMSAADQKCGIESLVDELCEKLKDYENNSNENVSLETETNHKEQEKTSLSPTDLARRYYAAFPPLSKSASANLISLIANNNLQKRRQRKPRQSVDTETMKSRSGGKNRLTYFSRNKRDFGFARSMEQSERLDVMSDWDKYYVSQKKVTDEGYSTSDTTGINESDDLAEINHLDISTDNIDEGHLANLVAKFDRKIEALWNTDDNCEEQNNKNEYHDLPVNIQELLATPTKQTTTVEILNVANHLNRASNKPKAFIQCGTNIISSIWTDYADDDNDNSLYDANIFSNIYNEALEIYPEQVLGDQFNSLSVANDKINQDMDNFPSSVPGIDEFVADNETNQLFECFRKENNVTLGSNKYNEFSSLPWEIPLPDNFANRKWSEPENYSYCSPLDNASFYKKNFNKAVNESLLTLNHNKEISCFREVLPKPIWGVKMFSAFNCIETKGNLKQEKNQELTDVEEDLLTSNRTHFRPIKHEHNELYNPSGQYADGTTFAIKSSFEQVNYQRSESGTLYLESEFDSPKKYMEYRANQCSNKSDTDSESCCSIEREFVLKFCVKQNEKCCQTEPESEYSSKSQSPLEVPAKKRVLCDPEEFFFPGDEELLLDTTTSDTSICECTCTMARSKLATNLEPLFNASAEFCSLHGNRPDSINWNSSWNKCDKCNNNWSTVWSKTGSNSNTNTWPTNSQSLQQIWSSSEELCRSCLGIPAGSGPTAGRSLEYVKLCEELTEDGEQLLSDLSCLQRVYMEQLPATELSFDFNDRKTLLNSVTKSLAATTASTSSSTAKPKAKATAAATVTISLAMGPGSERKRRHSSHQNHRHYYQRSLDARAITRNSAAVTAAAFVGSHGFFSQSSMLRPVTL